jgi:tetratricopeptide (TPR) repeat protein
VALLREAVRVRPDYARGRYNLAVSLEARGQLEEAERELLVLLRQDETEHADLYYKLGLLRARQGRWDEAIAAHRRAVELFPARPENLAALAGALANAGRREEALRTYREVVARAPHLPDAHYNIGLLLAEQGHVEEARRSLQEALALAEKEGNAALAAWVRGRLERLVPAPGPAP